MMIVGPGDWLPNGRHDLRPVFGVVTPAVKRVEFTYSDGGPPAAQAGLDGGFALTVESNRPPESLIGYDGSGTVIARKDIHDYGMHYCPYVAGCPPWPPTTSPRRTP